jgi:translation initiation factor 2 subunit 3
MEITVFVEIQIKYQETNNVIIIQNKVDVVPQEKCIENYNQIKNFVSGTRIQNKPIIPVSAQRNMNIDIILDHIMRFPIPDRDVISPARMLIVRSFDINKPGTPQELIVGGVAGGSILRGIVKVGDQLEIRPGIVVANDKDKANNKCVVSCTPIITTVLSLAAEKNKLEYAVPGGLIGIGTTIDPKYCQRDRQVVGHLNTLPCTYIYLEAHYRVKKSASKLNLDESLLIHIMASAVEIRITALCRDLIKFKLSTPVCCDLGSMMVISRKISGHWRVVGFGKVVGGKAI